MLAFCARMALKRTDSSAKPKDARIRPTKSLQRLISHPMPSKAFSTSSNYRLYSTKRRRFSTTPAFYSHPRLVLSEEAEMECPNMPTMFHLGRAIKAVNLLRNLDKYGRPLGVAVSEDTIGTPAMLEAVDAIPSRALSELLSCESGSELSSSVTLHKADMDIEEIEGLKKYPLPTPDVPGLFPNQAWKHWYTFLDQHVWKKTPTMATLVPEVMDKSLVQKKLKSVTPRDVFFSSMRGALTQAVQHFPSVLAGTIPLQHVDGNAKTAGKSWLRIGQSYWDAGNLTREAVDDMMAMRSEEMHFEETLPNPEKYSEISQNLKEVSCAPVMSRIYPGEEFKWIHFSPEDPRLLYTHIPPPLALIYQQLEQHLLLTPHFTLVPHQLEVYKEGVETLMRHDPLDPNYLGTVLIALPTSGTRGGAVRLTNLNHIPFQGSEDIAEEDLSQIDSDLSRVMAKLDVVSESPPASSSGVSAESMVLEKQDELDLERLDSDLAVPNDMGEAMGSKLSEKSSDGLGVGRKGSMRYQNWSSFTWSPFGGEHTVVHPAMVATGRGPKKVPASGDLDCEPSGLDWIAFTKNVPYCIEKLESGARVLLAYHIIGKGTTNVNAQQPTIAELQASLADLTPKIESQVHIPLVNALFSPVMRQAGIAKLVSMAAYYFNHAQPHHWLARGHDDLTSIGLALRDTYAPELLANEQLTGADAWIYNIFKWAIQPSSGIFQTPVRLILAPIAMIHQSQLHQPSNTSGPRKGTTSIEKPDYSSSQYQHFVSDRKKREAAQQQSSEARKGHSSQTKATRSTKKEGEEKTQKMDKNLENLANYPESADGTGSDRWETQRDALASSMVYFLNLEGWEHDGPSFSQQTYADCARFSALPARPLSEMERKLYGSFKHPSNSETQWNSIPLLFGQRWGEELDTWEPSPMHPHHLPHPHQETDAESFRVVGRKTYATTALILQKIQKENEKL